MEPILWFLITKKCVQVIFYSLIAVEKHVLLLFYWSAGSDFPVFSPAE